MLMQLWELQCCLIQTRLLCLRADHLAFLRRPAGLHWCPGNRPHHLLPAALDVALPQEIQMAAVFGAVLSTRSLFPKQHCSSHRVYQLSNALGNAFAAETIRNLYELKMCWHPCFCPCAWQAEARCCNAFELIDSQCAAGHVGELILHRLRCARHCPWRHRWDEVRRREAAYRLSPSIEPEHALLQNVCIIECCLQSKLCRL